MLCCATYEPTGEKGKNVFQSLLHKLREDREDFQSSLKRWQNQDDKQGVQEPVEEIKSQMHTSGILNQIQS